MKVNRDSTEFLQPFFKKEYLLNHFSSLYNYLLYGVEHRKDKFSSEYLIMLNNLKKNIIFVMKLEKKNFFKLIKLIELLEIKQNFEKEEFEKIFTLSKKRVITKKDFFNYIKIMPNDYDSFLLLELFQKSDFFKALSKEEKELLLNIKENSKNKKILDVLRRYFPMDFEPLLQKIDDEFQKENTSVEIISYLLQVVLNQISFESNLDDSLESFVFFFNKWTLDPNLSAKFLNQKEFTYRNFLEKIKKIQKKITKDKTNQYKVDLLEGKIDLFSTKNIILPSNISFDTLPMSDQYIISIDRQKSPDLDSAFSIEKKDGRYFLNIYVTDVPSFLNQNRQIAINAYKQGSSFYLREKKHNIGIDMIPKTFSHNVLSLNEKNLKNVIVFSFIFDNQGYLYSETITRQKIKVQKNLFQNDIEKILKKKIPMNIVEESLFNLMDLQRKVEKKQKNGSADDLISFLSVLVNNYVVKENEFVIYRDQGKYTLTPIKEVYARASAPLRRFCDDINLAILLRQNDLQRFNQSDFNYLENHIEEVVGHLNEQDEVVKFISKNNNFVKKYYKQKRGYYEK